MVESGEWGDALQGKLERLRGVVGGHGRMAVAFSAGVDSTLLLAVAHDVLGRDVLAVTGRSPAVPAREIEEAREFCRARGIRHVVVDTREFDIPGFERNPPERCYLCKRAIFSTLMEAAAGEGMSLIAEGSNLDDDGDYRPGFRAVQEMGVASPLREAGLSKADVRAIARHLGLSAWDKPAFACLNTRFAYGDLITPERLAMVDAAEEALRALGFAQVRVRVQDATARIEVAPGQLESAAAAGMRERIVAACKQAGFSYVALDLQGYRTGSMNEALGQR